MGVPPSDAGAVKVMTAEPLELVTDTMVGGPGTAAGIAVFDAADSTLLPTTFVARTVTVYDVPFVSPDTTHGDPGQVAAAPPGDAVTV